MCEAAEHHMGHLGQLLNDRMIQGRMIVAVNTSPPGCHAINDDAAIRQGDFAALG